MVKKVHEPEASFISNDDMLEKIIWKHYVNINLKLNLYCTQSKFIFYNTKCKEFLKKILYNFIKFN